MIESRYLFSFPKDSDWFEVNMLNEIYLDNLQRDDVEIVWERSS